MILGTSEALWDFVSAKKISRWIEEGCGCGDRIGGVGAYIVVHIWTMLIGFA